MGATDEHFTGEALALHLKDKVAGATAAVSLKDILGNLTFDARLTDPREKEGQVLRVDKILALNGIEGVFLVKEIATQIVKALFKTKNK